MKKIKFTVSKTESGHYLAENISLIKGEQLVSMADTEKDAASALRAETLDLLLQHDLVKCLEVVSFSQVVEDIKE